MVAEYSVTLENKTKSELILFIKQLQDMLKEKDKQLEKKDKIIDLMAEYIDENDTCLANYLYKKNGKCNKEMIKQYFKNKVKE